MGHQVKKRTRSFSMTDDEFAHLLARAKLHGFDRNEYVLALVEAEEALSLELRIHPGSKAKILRPAEDVAYGVSIKQKPEILHPTKGQSKKGAA